MAIPYLVPTARNALKTTIPMLLARLGCPEECPFEKRPRLFSEVMLPTYDVSGEWKNAIIAFLHSLQIMRIALRHMLRRPGGTNVLHFFVAPVVIRHAMSSRTDARVKQFVVLEVAHFVVRHELVTAGLE